MFPGAKQIVDLRQRMCWWQKHKKIEYEVSSLNDMHLNVLLNGALKKKKKSSESPLSNRLMLGAESEARTLGHSSYLTASAECC